MKQNLKSWFCPCVSYWVSQSVSSVMLKTKKCWLGDDIFNLYTAKIILIIFRDCRRLTRPWLRCTCPSTSRCWPPSRGQRSWSTWPRRRTPRPSLTPPWSSSRRRPQSWTLPWKGWEEDILKQYDIWVMVRKSIRVYFHTSQYCFNI